MIIEQAQPETREASHPFNKPSADVTLRSNDLVDFRVRSHILLEASPVFESILSSRLANQTPIQVDSDAIVLEALLLICYPISKPEYSWTLEEIGSTLRVAMKYEMDLPITLLQKELLAIARERPLEVWAFACRTGLEHIARAAAEVTLGHSTLDFAPLAEMEGITAGDYYRLREFWRLQGHVACDFTLLDNRRVVGLDAPDAPPDAKLELVQPGHSANLICRSKDGVEFHVHENTIRSASSVIDEKVAAVEERPRGKAKKGKKGRLPR